MPDKTDPNVTIVCRNTATAVLVTVGILLPLFLFGYAISGVCVAFGGLLLGVMLRACVRFLRRMVPISEGTGLAIVAGALALMTVGVGIWAAPQISDQLSELVEQVPADWDHLKSKLSQSPWGQWLISQMGQGSDFANAETVKTGGMVLYSAVEGPILVVIVLFLGLYFAADPHLYVS